MTEEVSVELEVNSEEAAEYVISALKNKDWFAARRFFGEDVSTIAQDPFALGMVILYFTEQKAGKGKSWEHYNNMTPSEVTEQFNTYGSADDIKALFEKGK